MTNPALRLVIGNKTYSSWSLRPWLLLTHFELPFSETVLMFQDPEFKAKAREFSPTGRVPALIHGDIAVWDSLAICEYVNEAMLSGTAWPGALAKRAHARAVVSEMHSGFSSLRSEMPMNIRRAPAPPKHLSAQTQEDIRRISTLWRELLGRFEGEFLFGDFSIADCFFAPVVTRFEHYAVTLQGAEKAYAERILQLPAMQAWYQQASLEELDPGHD
jgi:glutathione S-transferase